MNGIGIDYQQTLSVVGLREGVGHTAHSRIIGDGWRRLIPHAALSDGRWGSEARSAVAAAEAPDLSPPGGPWLDLSESPLFWRALHRRVVEFLGGLRPVPRHDFRVVVALGCEPESDQGRQLREIVEATEWEHVQWILATDALVCRWLASPHRDKTQNGVIAAVVVSDTSVSIAAYNLAPIAGQTSIAASTPLHRIDSIGHWHASQQVLAELRRRLPEPPTDDDELALQDGVLELAATLRRAKVNAPIPWMGALHERLFSTPTWTQRDCRLSDSVLAATIKDSIRRLTHQLDDSARGPDLILLGGVGSAWPIAADMLNDMAPHWQSPCPEEDIAIGAAWWPVFAPRFLPGSPARELRIAPHDQAPGERDSSGGVVEKFDLSESEPQVLQDIPPWERS